MESRLKIIHFTRQTWPRFSAGLGIAVAAWQRARHESTELQYPSHALQGTLAGVFASRLFTPFMTSKRPYRFQVDSASVRIKSALLV
jgi:hypothetical protein